jgi:hypothetical protein
MLLKLTKRLLITSGIPNNTYELGFGGFGWQHLTVVNCPPAFVQEQHQLSEITVSTRSGNLLHMIVKLKALQCSALNITIETRP